MSYRTTTLVLTGALALALSGCGDGDGMSVKGSSDPVTVSPGESIDLDELMGYPDIELQLDGVERDAQCSESSVGDGEWIALDLTLRRTGEAQQTMVGSDRWTAVGADGSRTVLDNIGALCLPPDEQFPLSWDGEDEITGRHHLLVPEGTVQVEHDVPHDSRSGSIVVELD